LDIFLVCRMISELNITTPVTIRRASVLETLLRFFEAGM
jgi:hypothetical protein